MKISVCGKGGSGKSVTVSLMAAVMQGKGYRVLVVDSDESNSGLFNMLGFESPPVPLMELVGGKRRLQREMKDAGYQLNVLEREEISVDEIPPPYIIRNEGLCLVNIGKILQSLEGCACPMGVLSREFLKKLRLNSNEIAIVDMEAGIEHFGRGVDTSIDSMLVVVEPSIESVTLAWKVKELASDIGKEKIWAVLNKVTSDEMASKLEGMLEGKGVDVIGSIHHDPEIFEACLEGRPLLSLLNARARDEVGEILDSLLLRVGR